MPEVAGKVDEVGDGDHSVVVQITFLPAAGFVEVGGEVDEVGDADRAVEIHIADGRVEDEHFVAGEIVFAEEGAVPRAAGGFVADDAEAGVADTGGGDQGFAGAESLA